MIDDQKIKQKIYNRQSTKVMAKEILTPGSTSLFLIIKFLNILFGICAIALIALGIWLWRQFGAFSILEILFIGLGFIEFLLVLLVWTAKTSVVKLRMYLFFMMIIFLAQLTSIIISFAVGQKIIDQIAKDSQKQIEQLKKYLDVVTYYCLGTLAIMLIQMFFVYCYIGSLRNRNFEFDYKFLDQGGNKMTLNQKNQYDREKVSQKYNQKRQQMYNKYPKYRQYKQQQNQQKKNTFE